MFNMFKQAPRRGHLARQARDACKRHPELCEYLSTRERNLRRTIQETPDSNDLELSANFNLATRLGQLKFADTPDDTVSRQAADLRSSYPDLHAYLAQRDARLERALSQLRCEDDFELCAIQRPGTSQQDILRDLGPGIKELAE